MKRLAAPLILFWAGVIVAAYYVIQKPSLLTSFTGLTDTLWTLFVAALLLFNAYGIGKRILRLLKFESQDSVASLLLCFGIGLGALGLLGLFFSVIQLADRKILTTFQVLLALFFLLRNDINSLRLDLRSLKSNLNLAFSHYSFFTKFTLFSLLTFSFLLTLVPPFEAFDVLINHLTQPAMVLQAGGLRAINVLPFWYPTLTENVYLWALAFGSERASQVIHFAWGILTVLFLWHWGTKTWGVEIGRKILLLLAAIPSLAMLASWAYADMPLCYYAVAALYTLTRYRSLKAMPFLDVTAVLAGMAMGVKYQSFVLPLACGILLLFERPLFKGWTSALRFSFITLLVAAPWYLRNAVFMGNPFYPFLFGGRYWDTFLARWWIEPGSGIGWNGIQIFMLPINVTLGQRDVTFFDGRFGPLFLLLFPLTVRILVRKRDLNSDQKLSLSSIACFAILSIAAWTLGVINTSTLWQARYLFPTVMVLSIPTALAWDSIKGWSTPTFRIDFMINVLIALVILVTLFDNAYFVLQRNPLAVAIGAQSRQRYIERVNPSYAALIDMMTKLPADARFYNLFEPRSYGLPRAVQPDPINSNFAHDIYLFKTPDEIIKQWKIQHFKYVIVYQRGFHLLVDSGKFTPPMQDILSQTLNKLTLIAQTPDTVYSIYEIP